MTSTPPTHLSEREMLATAWSHGDTTAGLAMVDHDFENGLITEREEKFRRCHVDPDSDAWRLVYADWLESRDTVYVECPTCTTPITVEVNESFAPSARYVRQFPHSCPVCTGRGEIPDDTDARHAELLRVQCELACPSDCKTCSGRRWYSTSDMESEPCIYCSASLRSRESAVLPALRDRLLPRCWRGCNKGRWRNIDTGMEHVCIQCKGSGRCPGTIERGLVVCEIPLNVCGREALVCPCGHEREEGMCSYCNRTDSTWACVWRPSDFARACVRQGSGFRVTDREPYHNGGGHAWFRRSRQQPSDLVPEAAELCDSLFDAINGHYLGGNRNKLFTTAAAAVRALGSALMRLTIAGSQAG